MQGTGLASSMQVEMHELRQNFLKLMEPPRSEVCPC